MARMLSLIASNIRGSIGGLTFLSNSFHQIVVRQKTAPVDPSTTYQAMMRSAFTGASATWEGLSVSDREAWKVWASKIKVFGPLGAYYVPARQWFTSARAFQTYINERSLSTVHFVTTAPIPTYLSKLSNVAPKDISSGTGVAVSFSNLDPDGLIVFAEISAPYPLARNRLKGPFLASTAKAAYVATTVSGLIEFDGLIEDAVYFIRVKAVTDAAGPRVSPEFIVRAVATTASP